MTTTNKNHKEEYFIIPTLVCKHGTYVKYKKIESFFVMLEYLVHGPDNLDHV